MSHVITRNDIQKTIDAYKNQILNQVVLMEKAEFNQNEELADKYAMSINVLLTNLTVAEIQIPQAYPFNIN